MRVHKCLGLHQMLDGAACLPLAGEGSSALFPQTHHDVRWLA